MLVVWGLSIAMISSLHNNFHLLETEEKSPEAGVCLPLWRNLLVQLGSDMTLGHPPS